MYTATRTPSTTCSKQPNRQTYVQTDYQRQVMKLDGDAPLTAQQMSESLVLLPFQILLNHLETIALREFEVAYTITLEKAGEFDDAYLAQINKFETALEAEFENYRST